MKHTIQNELISATILSQGIELCSLKSHESGTEYIWQANPEIWGSHAPVLFPIIGALKDGQYIFDGHRYSLPKHGLVRHSNKIELVEQKDDSLVYLMKWDQELLQQYPFKFEFLTRFSLNQNLLIVQHTVKNQGDNKMYFNMGGHPAFSCPLNENESYSDYELIFEKNETADTWLLDENGLLSGEIKPLLKNTNRLQLHPRLFDNDTLILKKLNSRSVTLSSAISGKVLRVDYEGFPYLGIWAKPGASFVCIEPWIGCSDYSDTNQSIIHKELIQELEPGKSFEAVYSIAIL